MSNKGDSIEPLPIHERDEVRGVDRDAGRYFPLPRSSPPSQIHRQKPPTRESPRFQILGERAEGVGAPAVRPWTSKAVLEASGSPQETVFRSAVASVTRGLLCSG
jgi:hypothetical protein